jgi:hypothetical protein
MNLIEQAIESYWGERCSDYEEGCVVCDAWRQYDNLLTDIKVEASIRRAVGKLIEEKDICTITGKNLNAS